MARKSTKDPRERKNPHAAEAWRERKAEANKARGPQDKIVSGTDNDPETQIITRVRFRTGPCIWCGRHGTSEEHVKTFHPEVYIDNIRAED